MLCAGTLVDNDPPATAMSVRCVIALDEVSCHRCAAAPAVKFVRLTVTGVEPDSTFEITITVSAPSLDRSAANTERLSALEVDVALTLVLPNVDLLAS